MKTNHKTEIYLLLVVAFTILFYPLEIGLNAGLYHYLLLGMCLLISPALVHAAKGRFVVALNALSGFTLFLYGNSLSVLAVVATTIYLAAYMYSPYASIFYSTLYAPFNLVAMPLKLIGKSFAIRKYKPSTGFSKVLAYILIPTAIITVFMGLYMKASPGFVQAIHSIQLNLSPGRILILIIAGSAWTFYIFYFSKNRKVRLMESRFGDELSSRKRGKIPAIDVPTEQKMGLLILVLLVILSGGVIISEFLYGNDNSILYADEVHKSTKALVTSIVLSILTIQWFLRYKDRLHHDFQIPLKLLASTWMAFNLGLVAITFSKNLVYVQSMGLSYLRIIIFFYLAACSIGLFFTLKRIFLDKNLWYLVRMNAVTLMILLVSASTVPWDVIVTKGNISIAAKQNKKPDMNYIRSLRHYDRLALQQYIDQSGDYGTQLFSEYSTGVSFLDGYNKNYTMSITLNEYHNVSNAKKYLDEKK